MSPNHKRQGMAIASLILGVISFMCLGLLAGIPAIILGHMAHNRARRAPEEYSGSGLATAGFCLGYASIVTTIAILAFAAGLILPALSRAKAVARQRAEMAVQEQWGAPNRAQSIQCVNNLKNIGLAFRIYSADHQGLFPFQAGTNQTSQAKPGAVAAPTAPQDAVHIFKALANELSNPNLLVCPADTSKWAAANFGELQADNISYEVETGPDVRETNPQAVLVRCRIHGNRALCDGSVFQGTQP